MIELGMVVASDGSVIMMPDDDGRETEETDHLVVLVPRGSSSDKCTNGETEKNHLEITTVALRKGSTSEAGNRPKEPKGVLQSCLGWSRKERILIFTMAIAEGTGFAALSVIAPLFPPVALERGISKTTSGLVFSSFAISAFIFAPIFGFLMPRFGVRFLAVVGLIVSGAASIAFGLMEDVTNREWFTLGCFAFRIMIGVSYSAYITAVFAAVTSLFQKQMGLVLSILEIVIGLGLSLGPALGSALFSVGGYKLPFTVMGISQFITAVPLWFMLPSLKAYIKQTSQVLEDGEPTKVCEIGKKKPLWRLFQSWEPTLILFTIMVLAAAFVYVHPILQPFLEEHFGTTENEAGFVFLANLGSYCLSTPISGILSDARPDLMYRQIIAGLLVAALGCQIVGPASYLQGFIPISMGTTIVGLIITGIGFSFSVIPTFHGFLTATMAAGYPCNVEIFGITSAFWNAAWSLGEAVGPAIASGVADATNDYVLSFMTISYILLALVVVLVIHVTFVAKKGDHGGKSDVPPPSSKAVAQAAGTAGGLLDDDPLSAATTTRVEDLTNTAVDADPKSSGTSFQSDDDGGESPSSSSTPPMYSAVSSPSRFKDGDDGQDSDGRNSSSK